MPNTTIGTKAVTNTDARSIAGFADRATKNAIDKKLQGLVSEIGKAKTAIDRKYLELAGAPGQPVAGVEYGAGDGFFRRYRNGIIYYRPPNGPCWVHGAILDEYLTHGAEGGFLGYPTTDERPTSGNTGRFNHFERGSIHWSYATGAHEVHGAIRDKWASMGWELSWLGFPVSSETGFTEDGKFSRFERGFIYWWDDIGAFDMGHVTLRYKGIYCFGETDKDGFFGLSDDDEPFSVLGVVPVPDSPDAEPGTSVRSRIYEDIDSGDSQPDDIELYRGSPHGIAIGALLVEHTGGNADSYVGIIQKGVELAGKGVGEGCGALFGPEAAPTCEGLWDSVAPLIVSTLNDLAGAGDRPIGTASLSVSAKQMVTLARQPKIPLWGIEYHFETPLISGLGASYKMYFAIEPA